MADTKQPTILIKKADGTKVRVTLDEFRKMRSEGNEEKEMINDNKQISNNTQITNSKPVEKVEEKSSSVTLLKEEVQEPIVLIKKEPEPIVEDELMVETPHELTMTTPVTDIFMDEAAANFEWNERDNKSLLEEDTVEVDKLKKQGKVHVGGHDLQEHIKMPSVGIDEDLENRAKSLVISWKKGIRNDNQFLDYAMRDVNHGGLGLDSEQANRFLTKSKDSKVNLDNLFDIVFEKNKKKANQEEIVAEKKEDTPTQLVDREEAKPEQVISENKTVNNVLAMDFSKPFSHSIPSSVVQDVTSPEDLENKTTGPQEEIAGFSLVDYRRLAKDPKKCADMLFSKFVGWKADSFLLYLDTLDGWKGSFLNKMYVDTTVEAINKKMSVLQVLQTKDPANFITLAEYESLVDINSKLVV